MGGVAIEHWGVAAVDLPGVVEHDNLRLETLAALGGVVFGITAHVAALDILDRQPLDVEACLARTALVLGVSLLGCDFG